MSRGRHWLLAGVASCAVIFAAEPPPPPAPPPPAPPAAPSAPDDDLIEFLGADDVDDAAWWEFLKKVPPRGENSPATPPQEGKE